MLSVEQREVIPLVMRQREVGMLAALYTAITVALILSIAHRPVIL